MATAIVHIENLHNNAYVLAPIIEAFFESTEKREKDILLSYLVLPLIIHVESNEKIKKSNKRSTIYTIFSDAAIIYGINERVESFKNITNKCLLLSSLEKSIKIEDDMSVRFIERKVDFTFCDPEQLKSAKKLAKLFNSHDIVEIYRKLGITKL
ncbi:hypothetical protein QUO13_003995 [Vibrio parahaemolyticus]|nr:hypothetical protein [Vibrio parahaemolyticus]ELA9275659.1 hypothetical protein [Vibrio parahaemolyticus]ELA9335009.1 hypothetical protein [Vibrio parahaemolyticus]